MHACANPACTLPDPHEGACHQRALVIVDYTNWKGNRAVRKVAPVGGLSWMSNPPWHPAEQWLLPVIDAEDGKHKYFAMDGIHGWREG